MFKSRLVATDTYYVGHSERDNFLFENDYPLTKGFSYNSYIIMDEKTCLLDTVDKKVSKQFIEKVKKTLGKRPLDYLIVDHMEPDHSATLFEIISLYPNTTVVMNEMILEMFQNFNNGFTPKNVKLVNEFDTLSLGKHNLVFVFAPMVHWPEVMMTYDATTKTLFSADAFGMFGALSGNLFADQYDFEREFLDDARRYYTNIVGKYGLQVQQVLKKAKTIQIDTICPLHGPIWRQELGKLITLYDKWSRYEPEVNGVLIVAGSIYGNMLNVADMLADDLAERGVKDIKVYDVSQEPKSLLVAEAFKYSHIVFMSSTYNMGIFTPMECFIQDLIHHQLRDRKYAVVEGGSWSPNSGSLMIEKLKELSSFEQLGELITIKSAFKDEDEEKLGKLGEIIAKDAIKVGFAPNPMFNISYGLYVLTSHDGKRDNGCIINTLSQVANNPDRVMVCVNKANYSAEVIKETGKCNVNIINKDANFDLFVRFGFHTGREVDKFEGFSDVARSENGLLYLTKQVNSYLSLVVKEVIDLGSHYGFICEIEKTEVINTIESATYDYYQKVIKPKPAAKKENNGQKQWVCKVCGYVYEYFKDEKVNVIKSHSTYLLWIDLASYISDSKEFADKLKADTGLWLSNGKDFLGNGQYFVRMNVATSLDNVKEGCKRLLNYLKN